MPDRASALLSLVVVVASVTGCTTDSDGSLAASTSAPRPTGGVVATLEVDRLFSTQRALAVGLQNLDRDPVQVREIRLESTLYETQPLDPRDVLLAPDGPEVVAPVPYGPPRCDADADHATFEVVLALDDGTTERILAVEKDPGAVGRVHAKECAAEAVRERADIRFGDDWIRDGRSMTGELILEQRRPGEDVTLDDVAGTVIFKIAADGSPPLLRVTDATPIDRLPVVVSAERCEAHALIESKKSFVFRTWVAVEDGDPVLVEVQPTGPARTAFDELFATCMS